ncbi:hypothetical protein Acr_29g0000520 [Actinidia rufa]|uniref:Uncharacterized protein n=1 Tax=Actinidia rufa TaxID=165716 RepID=A0A7J0HCN6_9ERIC|nr:hypothetical protein Acr_29g0000520 [Actinidia rufa]
MNSSKLGIAWERGLRGDLTRRSSGGEWGCIRRPILMRFGARASSRRDESGAPQLPPSADLSLLLVHSPSSFAHSNMLCAPSNPPRITFLLCTSYFSLWQPSEFIDHREEKISSWLSSYMPTFETSGKKGGLHLGLFCSFI